jgi:hypothetical protein
MLDKELESLLLEIKDGKVKGSIGENSVQYEDIETLVEHGYAEAIDISNKSGKGYLDPTISFKGKEFLRGKEKLDPFSEKSSTKEWTLANRLTALTIFTSLLAIVIVVLNN